MALHLHAIPGVGRRHLIPLAFRVWAGVLSTQYSPDGPLAYTPARASTIDSRELYDPMYLLLCRGHRVKQMIDPPLQTRAGLRSAGYSQQRELSLLSSVTSTNIRRVVMMLTPRTQL